MTIHKTWPISSQKELFRATFLSDEKGLIAFEKRKSQISMSDHPDFGSFRLLPLLFHRLQAWGIDDPVMMKFKGIVRQNWYKNQRFFRGWVPELQNLYEVGVECMLLYGPAIARGYYRDYALDPDEDFAILVLGEKARQAMLRLQDLGWRPEKRIPESLIDPYLAAGWMHSFRDAKGRRIRLYWHLLPECPSAQAVTDFWAGAIETKLHNVPVYIPNPADQILHICAKDVKTINSTIFLRTIDIMSIVTANPNLDWGRLLAHAERFHLVLPVLKTLKYIQDNLDEPLHHAFWQQLQSLPISQQDRLEYRLKTGRLPMWRRFWQVWFVYQRRTSSTSLLQNILGFPQYLQHYWRLLELRHVFGSGMSIIRQYLYRFFSKFGVQ